MAESTFAADRRQFLSASGLLPAALAIPAFTASHTDQVDVYLAAYNAHNADMLGEDEYIDALHRLDDWQPATHRDFVRKFYAIFMDGGSPTEARQEKLIAQSRHLLGAA